MSCGSYKIIEMEAQKTKPCEAMGQFPYLVGRCRGSLKARNDECVAAFIREKTMGVFYVDKIKNTCLRIMSYLSNFIIF